MNTPPEQCFICIHVHTQAFEKPIQITSKLCACKVYAHRECWQQFESGDSPTRCPYCYTLTQQNPMMEACKNPPPVVVERRRQRYAGDDPQVQCLMACCLMYFVVVGILGALYG